MYNLVLPSVNGNDLTKISHFCVYALQIYALVEVLHVLYAHIYILVFSLYISLFIFIFYYFMFIIYIYIFVSYLFNFWAWLNFKNSKSAALSEWRISCFGVPLNCLLSYDNIAQSVLWFLKTEKGGLGKLRRDVHHCTDFAISFWHFIKRGLLYSIFCAE